MLRHEPPRRGLTDQAKSGSLVAGNQTTKPQALVLCEKGVEVFQGPQCFQAYILFTHKMSSTFGESECSALKLGG